MHHTTAKTRQQKKSFWSPTNIALAIVFALWTLVRPLSRGTISATIATSKEPQFMAVIDAGSSGSQIYIYKYFFSPYGHLIFQPDPATFKSTTSLDYFHERDIPQKAGASLEPLLEFAKANVPHNLTKSTPIVLKVTSMGLRQVQYVQRNKEGVHSILQSVRTTLRNSNFQFLPSYAEIITGEEEATLGWLAINHLLETKNEGSFRHRSSSSAQNKPAWSVLNIGGSSVHVSIPLNDTIGVPGKYITSFSDKLLGYSLNLFTHPFDGFGIVDAKTSVGMTVPYIKFTKRNGKFREDNKHENEYDDDEYEYKDGDSDGDADESGYYRKRKKANLRQPDYRSASYRDKQGHEIYYHPCYPSGYREANMHNWRGIGSFEECQYAIRHQDDTMKQRSRKSFWKRIHGPDLNKPDHNKVWAFGIFYNIMSGVGEIASDEAAREFSISDFERIAKEICEKPWKEIDANYPKDTQPREYNSDLCFSAIYAHSFLTFGLGFDPQQRITIGNKVENIDIHWTVGAVLQHLSKGNLLRSFPNHRTLAIDALLTDGTFTV
ncbi:unnamed protein product [Cylindrotheca closterium]|uniref:Uncharacterized protein n=1 Tax=Cylindrotheca closterium TaxID=2856 RepID=A0AAD2G4W2_9STRA|nr:unnamed protein product [Cylindrotheca closterium]